MYQNWTFSDHSAQIMARLRVPLEGSNLVEMPQECDEQTFQIQKNICSWCPEIRGVRINFLCLSVVNKSMCMCMLCTI
jgi:hypothetical protein